MTFISAPLASSGAAIRKNRCTSFLSMASKSTPVLERPKAIRIPLTALVLAWGKATPYPTPVVTSFSRSITAWCSSSRSLTSLDFAARSTSSVVISFLLVPFKLKFIRLSSVNLDNFISSPFMVSSSNHYGEFIHSASFTLTHRNNSNHHGEFIVRPAHYKSSHLWRARSEEHTS